MAKLTRKLLLITIAMLVGALALAAIPFFRTAFVADGEGVTESIAYAEDDTNEDDTTVSMLYRYDVDYGSWKDVPTGMQLTGIKSESEDSEWVDVESVKSIYGNWKAGKYYVYVTPEEGKTWTNGTRDEREFLLYVNKAKLKWYTDLSNLKRDKACNGEAHYDDYSSTVDRVDNIYALSKDVAYNNNPDDRQSGYENIAKLIVTKDGAVVSSVRNAGEYLYTVEDYENYENPVFTLTVRPLEYEIGIGTYKLSWDSLTTGYVYEYKYEDTDGETHFAYLTSKSNSPINSAWKNWEYVPHENEYKIEALHAFSDGYSFFETRLDNPRKAFTVEYLNNGNKGNKLGKYTAVAKLTPSVNFSLKYTEPRPEAKSMNITMNEDGTVTVEKEWYIAYYVNEFLNAKESVSKRAKVGYTFPSEWTFGSVPEGLEVPYVAHGDEIKAINEIPGYSYYQSSGFTLYSKLDPDKEEQTKILTYVRRQVSGKEQSETVYNPALTDVEGWKNGENDIVTFAVIKDGAEICKDVPRSKFGYYINGYMPVGDYKIIFTVKSISYEPSNNDSGGHREWWLGTDSRLCNSAYMGASAEYSFKVKAGVFVPDDSKLNFALYADMPHLEADLAAVKANSAALFDAARTKIPTDGYILRSAVKTSETFWATVADDYVYADGVSFTASADGETYYEEKAADWANVITVRKEYKLYYEIFLTNYNQPEAAASAEGGETLKRYFIVDVYELIEIPVPESVKLGYNGEEQTLKYTEDDRFTVTGATQKEIGEYKAVFTLKDAVFTRWNGIDGADCEVNYSIAKGEVVWTEDPASAGWTWSRFSVTENAVCGAVKDGVVKYAVTTDEAGEQPVENLESFERADGKFSEDVIAALDNLAAGNYYLRAWVDETDYYLASVRAVVGFTVSVGVNGWKTAPTVQAWVAGEKANVPEAESEYGTAHIKVVADGDKNTVYYDNVTNVNTLANLPVGRYILIAAVDGAEGKYTSVPERRIAFGVCESEASTVWIVKPWISDYYVGELPAAPKGMAVAEDSTVEFTYGGEDPYRMPRAAGSYVMTATAYDKDGNEIDSMTVAFTVRDRANAAIVIFIIMILLIAVALIVVIVFIVIAFKKDKGDKGKDGGGDAPDAPEGEGTASEEKAREEDGEKPQPRKPLRYAQSKRQAEASEQEQPAADEEEPQPRKPLRYAQSKRQAEASEQEQPAADEEEPQPRKPLRYAQSKRQAEAPEQKEYVAPVKTQSRRKPDETAEAEAPEPVKAEAAAEPADIDEPVKEQPAEEPAVGQPLAYEQFEEGQPEEEQPVYTQPMYDMYGRPMYDMYGRPMYQQVYRQPGAQPDQYGQYGQPQYGQPQYGQYGQPQYGQYGQPAQPYGQYAQPDQYGQYAQPEQQYGQYAEPAPQPEQAEEPAQAEQPGQAEEPAQTEQPGQAEEPAQEEQPEQTEKPEQEEESAGEEQSDNPAGSDEK